MTTGLTPLLDSLRAAGSIALFIDFRQGQLLAQVGQTAPATPTGTGGLNRRGWWSASVTGGAYLTLASAITLAKTYTIMFAGKPTATVGQPGILSRTADITSNVTCHNLAVADLTHTIASNARGTGANFWTLNTRTVASIVRNGTASISFYRNGVFHSTPADHTTNDDFGTINQLMRRSPAAAFWSGTTDWILITTTAESAANQLLLIDELDNQIRYETNMLINNVSSYVAQYGILASEQTMTAGQSLGQLDPLKVSTGQHKCSTELYNGRLAKTIVCVANGNIVLPNPEARTTYTINYKKYTGGAWTNATSASTTIALTAGEKVLWATADGRDCLYMEA